MWLVWSAFWAKSRPCPFSDGSHNGEEVSWSGCNSVEAMVGKVPTVVARFEKGEERGLGGGDLVGSRSSNCYTRSLGDCSSMRLAVWGL